jgi:3-dehydroquinate dehydratase-2
MRILLINGPNLGTLGRRRPEIYGSLTLAEIVDRVRTRAAELDCEIVAVQANAEGALIDFLEEQARGADGLIYNSGAFTHYSYALRDAIEGSGLPAVEVHLSNVYAREPFRHTSVTAPVAIGLITGLGWHGYIAALDALTSILRERSKREGAST